MFQFIEKGMCGGISYIANRYGKANNKQMKNYDEKAPSKYITYLDANNLCGCAISQYLPTGSFTCLTEKELNKIDLAKYTEDSKHGLILEVDLEYPHSLHSKYMLSSYCETIGQKYNITIGQVKKLIATLSNREKYVLHYRNLQLYLDLGLKFKKGATCIRM